MKLVLHLQMPHELRSRNGTKEHNQDETSQEGPVRTDQQIIGTGNTDYCDHRSSVLPDGRSYRDIICSASSRDNILVSVVEAVA